MVLTVVPGEVTSWLRPEVAGAVTLAAVPVREEAAALPVEVTWLPAEDTEPLTEEAELASAEVAD
jgi:hypothetical protein